MQGPLGILVAGLAAGALAGPIPLIVAGIVGLIAVIKKLADENEAFASALSNLEYFHARPHWCGGVHEHCLQLDLRQRETVN